MRYDLLTLRFRSAVHFGAAGIGLEESTVTMHSDTFVAAVMSEWAARYGSPADLVDALGAEEPALHVSGLFPYRGAQRFVPRPFTAPRVSGAQPTGKLLRRVEFVDALQFVRWYGRGAHATVAELDEAAETLRRLSSVETRVRVAVPRDGGVTQIYYVGGRRFADNCGLYALVAWRDASLRERFLETIEWLGQSGIGGERSSGYGAFTVSVDAASEGIEEMFAPRPGPQALFATLIPGESESVEPLLEGARYRIREIRGWANPVGAAPRRRRVVRGLVQGSIVGGKARGCIVDVAPPGMAHPILRCGTAFSAAIAPDLVDGGIS